MHEKGKNFLKPPKETEESIRDRNRDSMFGTMLLTTGMSKEHE